MYSICSRAVATFVSDSDTRRPKLRSLASPSVESSSAPLRLLSPRDPLALGSRGDPI